MHLTLFKKHLKLTFLPLCETFNCLSQVALWLEPEWSFLEKKDNKTCVDWLVAMSKHVYLGYLGDKPVAAFALTPRPFDRKIINRYQEKNVTLPSCYSFGYIYIKPNYHDYDFDKQIFQHATMLADGFRADLIVHNASNVKRHSFHQQLGAVFCYEYFKKTNPISVFTIAIPHLSFYELLLKATYRNGKPPTLTQQHEDVEHHAFKKILFAQDIIPIEPYRLRLIQQYVFIEKIERLLQQLSLQRKTEINAFFQLTCLDQLWRTNLIAMDLKTLDVDPDNISKTQIAVSTNRYLATLSVLSAQELLAHFLLHTLGFMHGGAIINAKIKRHNRLSEEKITANQYNFSALVDKNTRFNATHVSSNLVKKLDVFKLSSFEAKCIFDQCLSVYESMGLIYDDLLQKHHHHPRNIILVVVLASLVIAVTLFMIHLLLEAIAPDCRFKSTYNLNY